MFYVDGKYNRAKIFTDQLDDETIGQIVELCNQPFTKDSKIRIMPDAHKGAGCTIGFTADLGDKVVPNLVGVDIGCLDSETEFLSSSGWKKISRYTDGDLVLQYDKNTDTANFVTPLNYVVEDCDEFYYFKNSKGLDQALSEEHKMLVWKGYKSRGYSLVDMNPKDFYSLPVDKGYYGFKASFNLLQNPINFSDDEIRLLVLVSADGCIRKKLETQNKIELHFKKERKIQRAKEILNNLNVEFNQYDASDGTVFIDFYADKKISKDLSILWKANKRQLKIVANESLLWDGHSGYRSFFSSTNKEYADVVQFAFASINIRAGISVTSSEIKGHNKVYCVTPTKNNIVGINTVPVKIKSPDGKKYCFTVPNGYFVARRNGKIFITGNCGMLTVELGKIDIDLPKLDQVVYDEVPSGFNSHENQVGWLKDLEDLECKRKIPSRPYNNQLGTLGGGNHFIEIDQDDDGNLYLVIHSGSRNLGLQIANYYQDLAIEDCKDNASYVEEQEKIIEILKNQGNAKKISSELKKLKTRFEKQHPQYPKDLCFLTGQHKEWYLNDMGIAQTYAKINRELMAGIIINGMGLGYLKKYDYFHTTHNYISFDDDIIRKGAISAYEGEKLLIPINMRDGSLYCIGKGNEDWNYSAPHGAGRLMSRSQAKSELSLEEFKDTMKGVYTTSVKQSTLDEAPMAYKNMDNIINNIQDTVEIVKVLKPIYNFKAS